MAFDRIQKLGDAKLRKIVNELARGTPAALVARLIQEWGDFNDVREDTLAKQLKRLKLAIENGAFGGALAEEARRKSSVRIKLLHGSTLNCLDALIDLAMIQEARVLAFWEREKKSHCHTAALNALLNDYRDLLVAIQKIKFDLGLDEYKRGIPAVRASETSVTLPDGTTMERRTLEAMAQMEAIFDMRGIPKAEDLPATPWVG